MKRFLILLVLSFGLSVSAAGFNTSPQKDFFVVNGEDSTENSVHTKHVVMLYGGASSCSGTIISDNAILTAAHCANSFGVILFGMGNVVKEVKAAVIHKDYNKQDKMSPDIAIVFFEGGLPTGFEAMAMATDDSIVGAQQEVFVAGYGQDITETSGKLKHFTSVLDATYADIGLIIVDNNEAGYACYGDSGGTTYILEDGEPVLVGVNNNIGPSFEGGVLCKTEYLFSAYVPFHRNWIEFQLNNYE